MAANRLSDDQKQGLVERYQRGEGSQALALAFGCSANTVTRLVKAALGEEAYDRLKRTRGKAPVALAQAEEASPATPSPAATAAIPAAAAATAAEAAEAETDPAVADDDDDDARPGVLAIDDADDFGDDDSDDDLLDDDDGEEGPEAEGLNAADPSKEGLNPEAVSEADQAPPAGDSRQRGRRGQADRGHGDRSRADRQGGGPDVTDGDGFGRDGEGNLFVAVPVGVALEDRPPATFQPLASAALPACVYMLVDKTVELQARPLSDFPELGQLPDGEQRRQALVVFANPRQAKRHCGRTQRVIKLPDSQVLQRTAPYLVVQGITRLVLEGAVYSLPGS